MIDQADVMFAAPQVAQVQEAFDERVLKAEWDAACADEQDAVTRKQAVLRKALARWPKIVSLHAGRRAQGKTDYSPDMRRFVRDVLGMPDRPDGTMNSRACVLLQEGAREHSAVANNARGLRARQIHNAVAELVTKYRLGADGNECMAALAKFYEGVTPNANT